MMMKTKIEKLEPTKTYQFTENEIQFIKNFTDRLEGLTAIIEHVGMQLPVIKNDLFKAVSVLRPETKEFHISIASDGKSFIVNYKK
jgi:hypothetical protein